MLFTCRFLTVHIDEPPPYHEDEEDDTTDDDDEDEGQDDDDDDDDEGDNHNNADNQDGGELGMDDDDAVCMIYNDTFNRRKKYNQQGFEVDNYILCSLAQDVFLIMNSTLHPVISVRSFA